MRRVFQRRIAKLSDVKNANDSESRASLNLDPE